MKTRFKKERMRVTILKSACGSIEDALETIRIAERYDARWLVIDGYHFGGSYRRTIKKTSKFKILAIDDNANAPAYSADLILNQNIHANSKMYSKKANALLLIGTQYVLLRREFLKGYRRKAKAPQVPKKILVTLGGSDPENVTLKVIQALQAERIKNLKAVIVAGGINENFEALRDCVKKYHLPIHLKRNVKNMPRLMSKADVIITAGGSTMWEAFFVGVPCLVIITADNQYAATQTLEKKKIIMNLGWHQNISIKHLGKVLLRIIASPKRRTEMVSRGKKRVDGKGPQRVLQAMARLG